MTPDEIASFLDTQRTLILVTLRSDGSPVAHPMWFARVGDALYINTRSDSFKWKNAVRDPRVCAVVEDGETYFALRGVRVEGRCQPVEDPQEAKRVREALEEKDRRIGSGVAEMPAWFAGSRSQRLDRGARVVLRIPMDRVYSWDFSKVREHYQRAAPKPE